MKADRLPVRAAEHNAVLPCGGGQEVSETRTLITTLLNHEAAPAEAVWETYLTRVERVGDHVRRGQGGRHRRGEPHLRPGAPIGIPAPGHPGSLGLADRHMASHDPVHDILPGHRVIIAGSDRRSSPRRPALSIPGRQRHSRRAEKARPKFPHATATKVTVTGNRPARQGRGPWNRASSPPRHTGKIHALTPATASQKRTQEQTRNTKLEKPPNATNT
jgi:hypothetical protein